MTPTYSLRAPRVLLAAVSLVLVAGPAFAAPPTDLDRLVDMLSTRQDVRVRGLTDCAKAGTVKRDCGKGMIKACDVCPIRLTCYVKGKRKKESNPFDPNIASTHDFDAQLEVGPELVASIAERRSLKDKEFSATIRVLGEKPLTLDLVFRALGYFRPAVYVGPRSSGGAFVPSRPIDPADIESLCAGLLAPVPAK
ncbi:MAG: hypothetical protein IV100_18710 [Myxococcales bacterium]|nr:hypothetical protein [Myxococcales bacterium]